MESLTVSTAVDGDASAWQSFALAHGDHHSYDWAWRTIIQKSFKHRPQYQIARGADGNIQAICPAFHVKSLLFGSSIISVPYVNAGGILAANAESYQAVLNSLVTLASSTGAARIELRHRAPIREGDSGSIALETKTHKVAMMMPLRKDPEELFSAFAPKLRSQIRRPSKSGVYSKISAGPSEGQHDISAFYTVFSENMRDLGTPVYPRSLFHEVLKHFGSRARVITAWFEDRPVAAGITLGFGKYVEIPWASSLRKHNALSPNMAMYWDSIKSACTDGYEFFDFGRSSPDSGTFRFKAQWGASPVPLHWYYFSRDGAIPDANPNNPKFKLLVQTWQKLPLPVANAMGPFLTRSLP